MFGLSDNNDAGSSPADNQYSDDTAAVTPAPDPSALAPSGYDVPMPTPAPAPTFTPSAPTLNSDAPSTDYTSPLPAPDPIVPAPDAAHEPQKLEVEPEKSTPPEIIKENKPSASALMGGSSDDNLLKMKQQALQSLAPLIDHLDQTPEEKFKTTMMLIQASDNAELVKEAYEAANEIKDEKVRAQALLDVVNEINYFTHSGKNPATPPSSS